MYHHPLLTCAVVVITLSCTFGDSNPTLIISEDVTTEGQNGTFPLQEEEPPANGTDPYVTEEALKTHFSEIIRQEENSLIYNTVTNVDHRQDENSTARNKVNGLGINEMSTNVLSNIRSQEQNGSRHERLLPSKVRKVINTRDHDHEEKVIIIFANSSSNFSYQDDSWNSFTTIGNEEDKEISEEDVMDRSNGSTMTSVENYREELSTTNIANSITTSISDEEDYYYSDEVTKMVNTPVPQIMDYPTTPILVNTSYQTVNNQTTDFFDDNVIEDIEQQHYTPLPPAMIMDDSNGVQYDTTISPASNLSESSTKLELSSTLHVTDKTEEKQQLEFTSTSAAILSGYMPEEYSVTSPMSPLSNESEKGGQLLSWTSEVEETQENHQDLSSESPLTVKEDTQKPNYPETPSIPRFTRMPDKGTVRKYAFALNDRNLPKNHPKPSLHGKSDNLKNKGGQQHYSNSVFNSVLRNSRQENSPNFSFTATTQNNTEEDLEDALYSEQGKETGPVLSFMSAVANMGENIARLQINAPIGKIDTWATTPHRFITKTLPSKEEEPLGFLADMNVKRRHDPSIDQQRTTIKTTSPPNAERVPFSNRRNDETLHAVQTDEDESIGSAWIGLGEYFKNDPPNNRNYNIFDEAYLKNLFEERSEKENGRFEYVDSNSDNYYDDISEIDESRWYDKVPKMMKHASLDSDAKGFEERKGYESPEENSVGGTTLLKRGKVIRSNMFFGEVSKVIKKIKDEKSGKISGYIKNKIGKKEPVNFGMPSLNMKSRSDSSLTMHFYNFIEKIGQRMGQDVSGGFGLVGSRKAYDGVPGVIFLPSGTFSVRTKEGPNRRTQREQIVPVPVIHPVTVPVHQPIPVRILQPVAVTIPVPIPVERTVTVPVERKIPYPVEKPVIVHIIKKIRVPVIKPYPVPVPVYKTQYILHHEDEENSVSSLYERPTKSTSRVHATQA